MDPPIGNGFRLQLQQQPKLIKSNTKSLPSTMSTSKCKKLLKIHNNNKKVSSITTRSNNVCKTTLAATTSTTSSSSPSWLRPQTRPEHSSNSNRLLSCNLSFIVCFLAVVILNNFACFIPTTQATASAQRENTRILPLQSGK
ncbi:uncharacterized protein LOC119602519 [Lucilia sericata]|uniref:uncharacterized protein LOC119602519 n=1 Tax=Lucilia sericata TaxID=13632 RepID=UPI0018A82B54|nr:uncharacterized protein LOC119602519 [Lucilia sericata]XP_037810016.1 uncharacterized protein LOC119602519 [Lucilia sericata]XP_037810017.1 uncharacterized protein LOC119602519 [Lucilia sericata]XP_037810018.1 uncharacterized protein LOC119602519 [Lucilia sericata]XP_037810019.1 uncharacterized protein LOC119602519 [Lucilia sericata]XP_037810020.1 uncharacterized protein LOC119602519 [Lucilia sericata]